MSKILVTGGTGFIGSHTTVALQAEGHDVVIVDNLCNSEMKTLDAIESISGVRPVFYELDLCDKEGLIKVFSEHADIDAIIHFAAHKAVGESVNQPLKYYRNNLLSLINLLEVMEDHAVNHFIFSSSCTVYGQPDHLPITEDAPIKPANSPYGNSKQISEEILVDLTKSESKISVISLRYFNPIGAHPSSFIGELPNGVPDNLIPYMTQTAAGLREELSVFGGDYDTPDGTCIRDYIHVVDIAEAHVAAFNRLHEGKHESTFEVFNLGTGKGNTVLEVIQSFERVTGLKLRYRIVDRRPGDVEQIFASTNLANEKLNWKAKYLLDDMTRHAWEWQKKLI